MQPQTPQLDPGVVNLTKAIRQTESNGNFQAVGKSGEYGAYQFTAPTWAGASQKYLGQSVPLQQATPEQQNEVAYKQIKEWKDAGHNVGEIASMWNAGAKNPQAYLNNNVGTNKYGAHYDTPAYAKSVAEAYQALKAGQQVQGDSNNPSNIDYRQPGSAPFQYNQGDSGITAGLKAIGNTPSSAINFAQGAVQGLNPMHIADTANQIQSGFSELSQQEGTGKAVWDIIKGIPEAAYHTLVPEAVQKGLSGDLSGATKSLVEDPFGQVAPVVFAAEGAAKLADQTSFGKQATADAYRTRAATEGVAGMPKQGAYSQMFDNGVSAVGGAAIDATKGTLGAPFKVVRPVVSYLTSIPPETLTNVFSNPDAYSKMQKEAVNAPSVIAEFKSSIDKFIADKQANGAEYNPIHEMQGKVVLPEDFMNRIIEKTGLKLEPVETKTGKKSGTPTVQIEGEPAKMKVTEPTTSKTRVSKTDLNAIQDFYDTWGSKTEMTPGEFLNFRRDVNVKLKSFEQGKTSGSKILGNSIYDELNSVGRPQVPGLRQLDEVVSPQLKVFKQLKKDFIDADGNLKDGAPNKILKALKKENLLGRMEQLSPGITKSLEVLDAIESIKKLEGKSGGISGHILETGGILTGNIPAIIAGILTHPKIALMIVRGAGLSAKGIGTVVHSLETITGSVPNEVQTALKVSGSIHPDNQTGGQLPQ